MDNRDQRIGNWERFIILEDNKASLAHFLSTEIPRGVLGISSDGDDRMEPNVKTQKNP